MSRLNANWDELSTKLTKARDELLKKRESIRPRMEILSNEVLRSQITVRYNYLIFLD